MGVVWLLFGVALGLFCGLVVVFGEVDDYLLAGKPGAKVKKALVLSYISTRQLTLSMMVTITLHPN